MTSTPPSKLHKERGAILVVSLIVTLVMTTMGTGLYYVANRTIEQIESHTDRSETLYSAETCIDEAIMWIETQAETTPPCQALDLGTQCHAIGTLSGERTMNSQWKEAGESSSKGKDKVERRMQAHSYYCNIRLTAIPGGANSKYIYKIGSFGKGPNDARSDIEVTVALSMGGSSTGGSDIGQGNEY